MRVWSLIEKWQQNINLPFWSSCSKCVNLELYHHRWAMRSSPPWNSKMETDHMHNTVSSCCGKTDVFINVNCHINRTQDKTQSEFLVFSKLWEKALKILCCVVHVCSCIVCFMSAKLGHTSTGPPRWLG